MNAKSMVERGRMLKGSPSLLPAKRRRNASHSSINLSMRIPSVPAMLMIAFHLLAVGPG